jgi:putative membrane protein
MKTTLFAAAFGLSVPFLLTSAAVAQAPTADKFVSTVAISDMFEIQSGKLAEQKAQNDDVKSFGEQMVEDHTKTSDELKELISDKEMKVELPTTLDDEHQAKLEKLQGLSGAEFDKQYMKTQVNAHQKAVSLFENYAASGDNEDLKEWAEDTLPTLKEHLEEAKEINQELGQVAEADTKKSGDKAMTDDQTMTVARDEDAAKAKDNDKVVAKDQVKDKEVRKSKINYVTRQTANDWSAEALIGRTVENTNGDNLGEINNVIINEKGDVVAVIIGVGGFLGIGEKDVGVPFEALEFRTEAEMERTDDSAARDTEERRADAREARFDAEHSDIVIVLTTTKEDLEAAPDFAWLGEQDADSVKREQVVR